VGQVSEAVGTQSRDKCKKHYERYYLEASTAPLPDVDSGPFQLTSPSKTSPPKRTPPKPKPEAPWAASLAGFMHLREEFDLEWDNEAEQELGLGPMEFLDSDTKELKDLKVKMLQIYNRRLDERARRRDFVVERGLLDFKRVQSADRKRTREEREIVHKMRSFAAFQDGASHEALIAGMIEEMHIKKKVDQLMKYRQLGIKNQGEVDRYEVEKKKRDIAEAQRKQKESAAYLYSNNSGRSTTSTSRGNRVRGGAGELSRGVDAGFDLDRMQASNLLATEETALCKSVRVLPQQYLIIKNTMVRECCRIGFLSKPMAVELLKNVEGAKITKIHAHFVKAGWVNVAPRSRPATPAAAPPPP